MKQIGEVLANVVMPPGESADGLWERVEAEMNSEAVLRQFCADCHVVLSEKRLGMTVREWQKANPYGSLFRHVLCPNCTAKRREVRRQLLVDASLLPISSAETDRFSTWKRRQSLDLVFRFGQQFAALKTPYRFLTLSGPVGVGKTFLARAIGWEWLEKDRGTVRYWQVPYFLDQLRRGYSREERQASDDTYSLLDAAIGCSLLLLDDLWMHKTTEWATEKLDEVIDLRYAYERHTVVTTNKLPAEAPDERIASRLKQGKCIDMRAADWRPQKGREIDMEAGQRHS